MIKEINKNDLNCNVFSVYDYDGLSMQELLSVFYKKINECVKYTNDSNTIIQWLKDVGIKTEVAIKLTELVLSGDFDHLLQESLKNLIDATIDEINNKVDKNNLFFNVKDYGAKGDGISDDSEAFKKAISLMSTGGVLYVPFGKYKIKDIKINKSDFTMKGDNSFIYTNSITVLEGFENVTFENLNFIGDLKYYKITEVKSDNFSKIKVEGNPFNVGDTFAGSNFDGIYGVDNLNFNIKSFDGIYYITDLRENGFNGNPLRPNYPMYIGNFNWKGIINFQGYNHRSTIKNCTFDLSTGYSIHIPTSNNIKIENNIFKNNGRDFILIGKMQTQDCENILINNNIFDSNIDFGKQCIGATNLNNKILKNVTIINNKFKKITETAVSFAYAGCSCDNIIIENNIFEDCDLYGIHILGQNIRIINNTFKDNLWQHAWSKIALGTFNDGNENAEKVVNFDNILIEGNTFLKRGIDIIGYTNNNIHVPANNVKISNNTFNLDVGGIHTRGTNVTITNNNFNVVNTTGDNYDWSCLLFNNNSFNTQLLNNNFNQSVAIRVLNNNVDYISFKNNNFGNLHHNKSIQFGGKGMTYSNVNILFDDNMFYKQVSNNIHIEAQEKTEFINNYYVTERKILLPYVNKIKARYNDTEAVENWIVNSNGNWLSRFYKIGHKTFRGGGYDLNYKYESGDIIFNNDFSSNTNVGWYYNGSTWNTFS